MTLMLCGGVHEGSNGLLETRHRPATDLPRTLQILGYTGNAFPSFDFFCQVMDQICLDECCLVIKNNATSDRIEDRVFWYKAEMHPPFEVGAEEFC
jgi:hypothetical protein